MNWYLPGTICLVLSFFLMATSEKEKLGAWLAVVGIVFWLLAVFVMGEVEIKVEG